MEIIHFAAKNPRFGYRKIASAFSVGRTQVQSIIKKKEEILTAYQSNRTGKFSEVNQALWDWYTLCRSSNIPVSGTMLKEEVLIIAEKLGIEGFAASNGWLEFTQNISTMSVAGEEGDVSSMTLESWKERSRELVRGWKAENIWNIDETGCFWKGLPEVSLNKKGSRCSGGKQSKQRNTWAFFVNAAGGKEDPIVIGQSERP